MSTIALVYSSQKTTAVQNEVALSYHKVRGLHFLAVVFVRSILVLLIDANVLVCKHESTFQLPNLVIRGNYCYCNLRRYTGTYSLIRIGFVISRDSIFNFCTFESTTNYADCVIENKFRFKI